MKNKNMSVLCKTSNHTLCRKSAKARSLHTQLSQRNVKTKAEKIVTSTTAISLGRSKISKALMVLMTMMHVAGIGVIKL
jgi:hypothetical protein